MHTSPTTAFQYRESLNNTKTCQPVETKICYLILPASITKQNRDDVANDRDSANHLYRDTTMSIFVYLSALTISEKQKARFPRAMRMLGVEPEVHFTQLLSTLSANVNAPEGAAGWKRHLLNKGARVAEPKDHARFFFFLDRLKNLPGEAERFEERGEGYIV
ncbi:hypothetical protein K432DRAFT_386468 [Lepidopterella palustris CBS 459.81]|uniref:Uncharacterized protein n=1 Tax=Lepidopterella palustris CBS 459.81 TaxID=1314670 RepID=A0A8E2E0P1_9PEZI|nr:hypothetical protein K432DRAFT_386468 [Lepidopterella palustris CBS 459.81]